MQVQIITQLQLGGNHTHIPYSKEYDSCYKVCTSTAYTILSSGRSEFGTSPCFWCGQTRYGAYTSSWGAECDICFASNRQSNTKWFMCNVCLEEKAKSCFERIKHRYLLNCSKTYDEGFCENLLFN